MCVCVCVCRLPRLISQTTEKAKLAIFLYSALHHSTSNPGMIHASQATADALCKLGMEGWIRKCHEEESAYGDTYWIYPKSPGSISSLSTLKGMQAIEPSVTCVDDMMSWYADTMKQSLNAVLQWRDPGVKLSPLVEDEELRDGGKKEDMTVPPVNAHTVMQQLGTFVENLQLLFVENMFHNMDHSYFVAMHMSSILRALHKKLDPLEEFACLMACWIADLDHPGVTNDDLIAAKIAFPDTYRGRSLAQQHSFHRGWSMFLHDDHSELRTALCPTDDDLAQFRKMLLGCVLATDALNPSLSAARKSRWERKESSADMTPSPNISASRLGLLQDLVLTAHYFHFFEVSEVFLEWNQRAFNEASVAYLAGRSDNSPAPKWNDHLHLLFNNITLPLSHQLVKYLRGSNQYAKDILSNVQKNHRVWKDRGTLKVEEMKIRFESLEEEAVVDS